MKETGPDDYAFERNSLRLDQIHALLDRSFELISKTTLVDTLVNGGSALFPHTYISQCGDQIGAVAEAALLACQKSGKKQILLIGVLHGLTDILRDARNKEIHQEDLSAEPCRGVFGPGLKFEELLCKEFSLEHFLFLLEHAARKKAVSLPKIVIRYPYLINGDPESLNGIDELKALARESIVVATADLCHHGAAYGNLQILPISQEGYNFAYQTIEKNLRLLSGDLLTYRKYCLDTKSDSADIGQLLNFLLGPFEGRIHDLKLIDVADLFDGRPSPSWVAATLVELVALNR